MPDISTMSTDELRAMARAKLQSLSTDQLRQMAKEKLSGGLVSGEVKQEMHPDISMSERFTIKNFGGDDDTAISYLKKRHPDLEVSRRGEQIVAKKKGEKDWRVLDPDHFDFQDISDVIYDTVAGFGSGLSATAAGLGVGAATGGAGAIPAAMAAGGASAGGLEALRQKIGAGLGVSPEELDAMNIGISAVLGGATPLAFGTGATKSEIASLVRGGEAKGLVAKLAKMVGGESDDVVSKALQREGLTSLPVGSEAAQAAAVEALAESQRGALKYAPKVAAALTGVPEDTIKNATKPVNASIKKMFGIEPEQNISQLELAEKIRREGAGDLIEGAKDQIHQQAKSVTSQLQDRVGQALTITGEVFDPEPYRKIFAEAAAKQRAAKNKIGDEAAKSIEEMSASLFGEGGAYDAVRAMQIKNQVSDVANFAGKATISPADDVVESTARSAWHKMSDDLWQAVQRSDKVLGEKGNLRQIYRDHEDIQRLILPKFKSGESAEAAFGRFGKSTKRYFTQKAKQFDQKYGTNIENVSQILDVEKFLAEAPLQPYSGGSTSTSKTLTAAGLGALGGSVIGSQLGGGGSLGPSSRVGAATGAVTAGLLGSPAALKAFLSGYIKAPAFADIVRGTATKAARTGAPVTARGFYQEPQ